jgi:hypothetical protein
MNRESFKQEIAMATGYAPSTIDCIMAFLDGEGYSYPTHSEMSDDDHEMLTNAMGDCLRRPSSTSQRTRQSEQRPRGRTPHPSCALSRLSLTTTNLWPLSMLEANCLAT